MAQWSTHTNDNVHSPAHYASGKIEVAEAIEDWKLGFHLGNVVKYVARAGKKDISKEIEDLEKARWYLSRQIELLKAGSEGRVPLRPNEMKKDIPIFRAEEQLKPGEVVIEENNSGLKDGGIRYYTLEGEWHLTESQQFVFVPLFISKHLKIEEGARMQLLSMVTEGEK